MLLIIYDSHTHIGHGLMKDPKIIVALIYAVAALMITMLVMIPVYKCTSEAKGLGQLVYCLHGMPARLQIDRSSE